MNTELPFFCSLNACNEEQKINSHKKELVGDLTATCRIADPSV